MQTFLAELNVTVGVELYLKQSLFVGLIITYIHIALAIVKLTVFVILCIC